MCVDTSKQMVQDLLHPKWKWHDGLGRRARISFSLHPPNCTFGVALHLGAAPPLYHGEPMWFGGASLIFTCCDTIFTWPGQCRHIDTGVFEVQNLLGWEVDARRIIQQIQAVTTDCDYRDHSDDVAWMLEALDPNTRG